jgi:bifunctional DNA-binding transcriptional regulator/antitoxin component of YhaV-PrlF toxin-antitoxin module
MMMRKYRTKVGRSSQTVVPAPLRRKHKIRSGDQLEWEETSDGFLVRPRRRWTLRGAKGVLALGGDAVKDKRRAARGEIP